MLKLGRIGWGNFISCLDDSDEVLLREVNCDLLSLLCPLGRVLYRARVLQARRSVSKLLRCGGSPAIAYYAHHLADQPLMPTCQSYVESKQEDLQTHAHQLSTNCLICRPAWVT
jgi:hypothetical protein